MQWNVHQHTHGNRQRVFLQSLCKRYHQQWPRMVLARRGKEGEGLALKALTSESEQTENSHVIINRTFLAHRQVLTWNPSTMVYSRPGHYDRTWRMTHHSGTPLFDHPRGCLRIEAVLYSISVVYHDTLKLHISGTSGKLITWHTALLEKNSFFA